MNHGEMRTQAIETAYRLIDESQYGQITGELLALEMGLSKGRADEVQLYHALMAAKDEGSLRCDFPGGMQLPIRIRR